MEAQAQAPELRPLGVGEILDVAIKIYWRNALTFFRIVLFVVAPVQVISSLVSTSAHTTGNGPFEGGGPFGTSDSSTSTNDATLEVTAFLAVTVLSYLAGKVATGACFKAVADGYLGERPDWRTSIRYAFRRLHSIVWVTFLAGLASAFGLVFCIIPGIFLWVSFSVAVPVLLTEGIKGTEALGRSKSLVEGRWWPAFGILLVGSLLAGVVSGVTGGLAGAFAVVKPGSAASFVVAAIAGTIGSMISTPFTAAFTTVLYFDLRVRKEGFDLELLAERIGLKPRADGDVRPAPPAVRPAPPSTGQQPPYWPPPPGWRPSPDPPPEARPSTGWSPPSE